MEKILGIIAEYNPFHNGHLYHLQESKKETGSKYTVAIIGNNFSQRGSASIVSKWDKTEMLLKCGIDLVIEMPQIYSCSYAENFAYGSISILNSLNIIDYISFGSEAGNIESLSNVQSIIMSKRFQNLLKEKISDKVSYPKAMSMALKEYSSEFSNIDFLESNNILAIEYLNSLKKLNSRITPITIKRLDNKYNDLSLSKGKITSATSIRNSLEENYDLSKINKFIPKGTLDILKSYKKVITLKDFEKEIIYSIKMSSISRLSSLPEVSEGLEYKIKKASEISSSLEELIDNIKSKRYTISRIQRILVYSLLNITKDDLNISKSITPYVKVLGFNENGKKIISKIKRENKKISLITSLKSYENTLDDINMKRLLEIDKLSTSLYTSAYLSAKKIKKEDLKKIPNDYNQKLITI